MIDPAKITNYARTREELEEFWIFCICVANKNADRTALVVHKLLAGCPEGLSPLEYLHSYTPTQLLVLLKTVKTGQYNRISRALTMSFGRKLYSSTLQELEGIAGPKTARYFLLHSRRHVACLPLDTHLRQWLRDNGYEIAESVPTKGPTYSKMEAIAIRAIREKFPHLTLAQADLHVWNTQRAKQQLVK